MNPLLFMRPGDWLVLLAGGMAVMLLGITFWHNDAAQRVVVRSQGQVFAEAALTQTRRITIPGPLGPSVVEIQPGRVRVAADPSPRQLCVRQGWLTHAGDAAICLPNQISVELVGRVARFDSLNY